MDDTGYTHGQRGKVTPTSWTCEEDRLRVSVFRRRHHDPGLWFVYAVFRGACICDGQLTSPDLESAKIEALRCVVEQTNEILRCAIVLADGGL
jgi:hypothetical protein